MAMPVRVNASNSQNDNQTEEFIGKSMVDIYKNYVSIKIDAPLVELTDVGLKATALGTIGYLTGHGFNHMAKILKPTSIVTRSHLLDPLAGAASCVLFVAINELTKIVFKKFLNNHAKLPLVEFARVAGSAIAATVLTNLVFRAVPMTLPVGAGLIATATVAYVAFFVVVRAFDHSSMLQNKKEQSYNLLGI
jgi:hypothetical protein